MIELNVDKMKHLGFLLRSDLRDDNDMNRQLIMLLPTCYATNSFHALNLLKIICFVLLCHDFMVVKSGL